MKILSYLLCTLCSISCFANYQADDIKKRNRELLKAQKDLSSASNQKNMKSLKVLRQLQLNEKRYKNYY
jgi:hypothetical protein